MVSTVAVGTDGSGTASKAVQAAVDLAARFEARIVFLSVYHPKSSLGLGGAMTEAPDEIQWSINPEEEVDKILSEAEQLAEERGLRWASEAQMGEPAEVLVRLADKYEADVLVIGNRGMHRRVLGSVPNSVTHSANCTVFLVKTS